VSPWSAARAGDPVNAIDTPALVLDLDAFERNLERMAAALRGTTVRLRAHAKAHKCPEIARRQVALGAVGVCCQKVSEAAVFAEAGIKDILVTNEVLGTAKLRHLVALARTARIGVLVDHPQPVDALAAAAREHKVRLDVYVEIDVGAHRCGVAPGDEAVQLARRIASSPPLRFAGLHCYQGSAQHMRAPEERAAAIAAASEAAHMTKRAIEALGIAVECVTGGGSASFVHERDSGVFTEVQAGSYAFMDRDYGDNRLGKGDVAFEHALFVRTTVMSRPTAGRAVVDAGLKASSVDSGMPGVWRRPDLRYLKASDEHGVLATPDAAAVSLGDTLMLVPGHCDPTFNLYDELVCIRGDRVEAVWPIAARGALL
jgi:D-serine deaminase-like pyridoxal phosphate-dependent protein